MKLEWSCMTLFVIKWILIISIEAYLIIVKPDLHIDGKHYLSSVILEIHVLITEYPQSNFGADKYKN